MAPTVQFRISNIVYLKKPVKDYQKPFRFTLTALWEDQQGVQHGFDIVGNLGGVGRDGEASWNGPMFWMGRKAAYTVHVLPGTYESILAALMKGGYFKGELKELLDAGESNKPVSATEEYGLPTELDV